MNNDGSNAVRFVDPGVENLTVSNVNVTGNTGARTLVKLSNADIDVQNLCISQEDDNRDGVSLENVPGSLINAKIDITGDRVLGEDDGVKIGPLRENGACSLPRDRNPSK